MYGKSFVKQTVINSTNNAHTYHMKRTGGEQALSDSAKRMVDSIHKRVNEYGGDFMFSVGGCDEECERELEMEIEEEEEVEVEVPSVDPVAEKKWNFKEVFLCQSPSELPISVQLLPSFIEKYTKPAALAKIKWSKKIFCTDNFARTIICRAGSSVSALNRFLRVVNYVLRFPDGSILLVSEFEANNLLSLFWQSKTSGSPYQLFHSSFLRQSLDESNEILLQRTLPKNNIVLKNLFGGRLEARDVINEISMASLQLFAGESTYATEERKEALKSLLRARQTNMGEKFCPRTEAERMVEMRGQGKTFPYSDLETLCEQLLCEL
ncbi:hypothetical protein ACHAXR_002884 [Thalassiosira sp. AJA248-18]